ncbi:MBL fold metallo-hydrolase [Cronobacter universalis]|uniref:MBL fold metallo-hydrolase n=1 Tax=Cronobacter universalis TaxID=535744 RepID=UPI0024AFAC7D|nr:MBL fold metallo-hydrolase [Cronobacter universalis]MDI7660315.1 MBL fold metallo-hydrolase [Cronobacter universalis]
MEGHTFASRQVGDYQVTALFDGAMAVGFELLAGIDAAAASEIQSSHGVTPPATIDISGYLIRGHGRVMLVDAGTGGRNNAGGGLSTALRASGVAPEDIDTVFLTHGHPDHLGGLLREDGEPAYPHATLCLHPAEAAFWQDEARLLAANERTQRNILLARRTLERYAPRLRFTDDADIAPGVRPVPLPGHTPGHTGLRIDSRAESLLIWGDIVHYPFIQTAHPSVTIAFDNDPAQAEITRQTVLAQAAREHLLIAGMHTGRHGFAYVQQTGDGYRLIPA